MRYGICLANFGTYGDPRNVLAIAEEAEAAGWEALLVWDHLSFVWGPPAADPWVTLAAVAARTERLILGTNLTPLPRRRPHVLAHQVATLDVLSGGRTVFAAGIGGVESEFAAFGEPVDARLRAEMLDEGLDVLRGLWSGEQVTHRGTHYVVDGVELKPRPVQERIPIWIGGNSPPALRRAARFDGWAADSESPEGMRLSPGRPGGQGRRHPGGARRGAVRRRRQRPEPARRPGRVRSGRRDLVARDLPRHAGQLRRSARGRTRRTAALAGEAAEHPAEERVPPARLRERARGSRGAAAARPRRARGGSGRRARSAARARRSRRARAPPARPTAPRAPRRAPNSAPFAACRTRPAVRQCFRLTALPRSATSE